MGTIIHAFPDSRAARVAGLLLNKHRPRQIADAITVLIDVLDLMGGDPDAEDNGDSEPVGDEADLAWPEWNGRRSHLMTTTHWTGIPSEDDEEDDPSGQCDEDGINTQSEHLRLGPGCEISDAGEENGDRDDDERARDLPKVRTLTLD